MRSKRSELASQSSCKVKIGTFIHPGKSLPSFALRGPLADLVGRKRRPSRCCAATAIKHGLDIARGSAPSSAGFGAFAIFSKAAWSTTRKVLKRARGKSLSPDSPRLSWVCSHVAKWRRRSSYVAPSSAESWIGMFSSREIVSSYRDSLFCSVKVSRVKWAT